LYANGVPMDEAQLQAAFAAYHAELDELPPPAERNQWQTAQQIATSQRLAVITGTLWGSIIRSRLAKLTG
jgi:hypothetical protein